MNLLVLSAGRRVHLIRCFREDAEALGLPLRVICCDTAPELSAACQVADLSLTSPASGSADYPDFLEANCRQHAINIIVPTIDHDLRPLAASRERLSALGVLSVISAPSVVDLARSKLTFSESLAAHGIPHPATASLHEFLSGAKPLRWPLIAKPDSGSSSVGIVIPASPADLERISQPDGMIVQELWTGDEYTVNAYVDGHGRLAAAVPHKRLQVRGGEVSKARTERIITLCDAAVRLADSMPGLFGPVCFQSIVRPDGAFAIFELNARFGGGFPLAHRAGARMSKWLLEEAAGLPPSASDIWTPGMTMLRFDDAVFVA